MLIPCIDLQEGKAVQLVHGRQRKLAVAEVMSLLLTFKKYKWLHVIDLDAAKGKGNNRELARKLCLEATKRFGMKVRVGGGIRTVRRAEEITKWGAHQVIVGSAAFKNGKINAPFLRQLRHAGGPLHNCRRAGHRQGPDRDRRLARKTTDSSRKCDGATRTVLRRISLHGCRSRRNYAWRQSQVVRAVA